MESIRDTHMKSIRDTHMESIRDTHMESIRDTHMESIRDTHMECVCLPTWNFEQCIVIHCSTICSVNEQCCNVL